MSPPVRLPDEFIEAKCSNTVSIQTRIKAASATPRSHRACGSTVEQDKISMLRSHTGPGALRVTSHAAGSVSTYLFGHDRRHCGQLWRIKASTSAPTCRFGTSVRPPMTFSDTKKAIMKQCPISGNISTRCPTATPCSYPHPMPHPGSITQ